MDKSLSFDQAAAKSKDIKEEKYMIEVFLKEVDIPTWKQAKEVIPQFADMKKLKSFNVKKKCDVPPTFKVYLSVVIVSYRTSHTILSTA